MLLVNYNVRNYDTLVTSPPDFCRSQAAWLSELTTQELEDYDNPTGKIQTHLFYMKYNANVAASKFKPKETRN